MSKVSYDVKMGKEKKPSYKVDVEVKENLRLAIASHIIAFGNWLANKQVVIGKAEKIKKGK